MLQGGFFIGKSGGQASNGGESHANLVDGDIVFSPIDNIFIDENEEVFYSTDGNAYLYEDADGNIFAKKVR